MNSPARRPHASDAAIRLIEQVEKERRSRPLDAWQTLARGFEAAQRGAPPGRRGELWRLRGHLLRSLRRLEPALRAYRRAERWYRRARDMREVGRCAPKRLLCSICKGGEEVTKQRT